ncbi:MAG: hypothetical protein ABI895_33650 [Deltaproteobacteria bacterium]
MLQPFLRYLPGALVCVACSVDERQVNVVPAPDVSDVVSDGSTLQPAPGSDANGSVDDGAGAGGPGPSVVTGTGGDVDPSDGAGDSSGASGSSGAGGLTGACVAETCPLVAPPVNLSFGFEGDGLGTVTLSVPGGQSQSCSEPCIFTVPAGSEVTATVQPGPTSSSRGWSNAACSTPSSCSLRLDAAAELNVRLELGYNVVFVTSQVYDGASMPSAGAQANGECARLAAAAGLHGSRWVAWLSSDGSSPATADDINAIDSFQSRGGWVRTDGLPFARSLAALSRAELLYPELRDERRGPIPTYTIWTGSHSDGRAYHQAEGLAALDCNGWTSNDAATLGAYVPGGADSFDWMAGFAYYCNEVGAFYCFGDDSDAEVPIVTPSPSRLSFLSTSDFSPTSGLAAADALCQRDACMAGLTGGSNCAVNTGAQRVLRAYLHTSTQKAWERFNLDGPNWVRPDGITWLRSARALGEDGWERLADLSVTLDQSYVAGDGLRWVGRPEGNNTCGDWTDATQLGGLSYPFNLSAGTFDDTGLANTCDTPHRVYCLEQ